MSQALYRKYRPKTFDEVYGQSNIVNILKNQIDNNKISHAYLFSGTRGTGKTSCAKIFSRAVNCLNPKDGNPCNECANCKAILDESTMDVIEMDAASNRRIDDIRQLRDTVIYPPTDLKYKVYIIDEAHMITNEGFNALLKIMEEPPKHLIFILATTEVDKIPDTILSRTQRFEFKKIEDQVIEERIADILEQEEIKMDSLAINSISNIGKGSMRDALSTLDQVISMNKDEFNLEDINDILGIVGTEVKLGIYQSVIGNDVKTLMSLVDKELDKGKDSHNIIKEMIAFVELLLDTKIGQLKEDIPEEVRSLVKDLSLDYIINSLDILVDYELRIRKSDNRNLLLKMSMIRLLDNTPKDLLIKRIEALEDRICKLEEGDFTPSPKPGQASKSAEVKKSNVKPVSIANGNPFEDLRKDVEEKDLVQDMENAKAEVKPDEVKETESVTKTFESEAKHTEVEAPKDEANPSKADAKILDDKKQQSIERAIRNYVLNKFPSSKQLYDQVISFTFRNEQLIYLVNEKGYAFSKVMAGLFAETEEAFYRQTKIKIIIKFELRPSKHVEEVDKNDDNIKKIKNFFGTDNLEIIE